MKKKVVWLVVSCWMVAALLLASCAPEVVKEEEEKVAPPVKEGEVVVPKEVVVPEKEANMVKWTGVRQDGTVVEKMLEKPRYGGVHITSRPDQPAQFDDMPIYGGYNWVASLTHDTLRTRDWSKGPLGTDEWSPQNSEYPSVSVELGSVAESWEVINTADSQDLVYHIRKGIRWQDRPPLNGRELTPDDVLYSLRRNWEVGYASKQYPYLTDMKNVKNSIYVSPTDKWAVVIKNQPGKAGVNSLAAATCLTHIIAPEVIDYKINSDWKKMIGTGPFILQEYVGASALTLVRNPNYWMHDPFFPENQLPYIDTLKILIIPDLSTQMAGLRTGKIDNLTALEAEDAEQVLKTNPELESVSYIGTGIGIRFRVDTKPFDDVRVRQALWMAIDNQEILDKYYGGKATLSTYVLSPIAENRDIYVPVEKMSELVQEMYGYHPDKAKQLLAEAGYPQGFKTEVLCWSAEQTNMLQIVQDYWSRIGVDLKLDVREYAAYYSVYFGKNYKQMGAGGGSASAPMLLTSIRKGGLQNTGNIVDPEVDTLYEAVQLNYFDRAKIVELYTKPTATRPNFFTYAHEQAWSICLPAPHVYALWQPWLKNYGGATTLLWWNAGSYPPNVWIDQELKKAMGR